MRFLFCASAYLMLCFFALEAQAERKALLIGNAKYQREGKLRTPSRDIKKMSKLLRTLGYRVTVKHDVKVREFPDVVADYADTIKPNDEVYFHYSGHGLEIGGEALLLGVDFKARSKRGARFEGFSVGEVVELMGRGRAAVVVIDACRNNPYARSIFRTAKGSNRGLPSSNTRVSPPERGGVYLVFSTTKSDVAQDGNEVSPFVEAFSLMVPNYGSEPLSILFGSYVQGELQNHDQELEMRLLGKLPVDFRLKPADSNCPVACQPRCSGVCVKMVHDARAQNEKLRKQSEELERLKREREGAVDSKKVSREKVHFQGQIREQKSDQMDSSQQIQPQKPRGWIAILDLKNQARISAYELQYLNALLRSTTHKLTHNEYRVMTREAIQTLLPPNNDLDNHNTMCEIDAGHMLGVHWVVSGKIIKFGSAFRLNLNLYNIKSNRLLGTRTIKSKNIMTFEALIKLEMQKLLAQINYTQ